MADADACTSSVCMLVTANLGSIFEDPTVMMSLWISEFLSNVQQLQPQFLAFHCQEVGGKQYQQSMQFVEEFVRRLMASTELMEFDRVRVFLDEDFSSFEKFTALGSFYFIHETIKHVEMWDFKAMTFVPVLGKEVHSGNIENVTTKEKAKFAPDIFPECKWSRKGFLRTRWYINGTIFDLVNIHLFHDASNLVAMENFPSTYGEYRKQALSYVLDRVRDDEYEKVPFFVFGDFNFRLNTQAVVTRLTSQAVPQYITNDKNGQVIKILYKAIENDDKFVLTLGKKEFDHHEDHAIFSTEAGKWLHDHDLELTPFLDRLFEYEITFPPSYPFSEDVQCANTYMKTRCPAWCDRILLSKNALPLVYNNPDDLDNSQVLYHCIGQSVCMGDHKPVFLVFRLVRSAGMLVAANDQTSPTISSTCSYSTAQPGSPVSPDTATREALDIGDKALGAGAGEGADNWVTPPDMSSGTSPQDSRSAQPQSVFQVLSPSQPGSPTGGKVDSTIASAPCYRCCRCWCTLL